MWRADCLRSSSLLQATLNEMGLSAHLQGVSLVKENVEERSLSSAVSIVVDRVPTILESLQECGFFGILGDVLAIAATVRSTWAQTLQWEETEVIDLMDDILTYISRPLLGLAPNKVLDVLWHLKLFLEEARRENVGQRGCLEHLTKIYQALEEVQPWTMWKQLFVLQRILVGQRQAVAWLAGHPLIEDRLGSRPNLFDKLESLGEALRPVLADASIFLSALQGILHELGKMEAIVPHPGG